MDILEEHSPELIREAGIDIRKLCLKFCGKKNVAALPASSHIEHIFSEVYNLPEKNDPSISQVKMSGTSSFS